MDQYFDTNQFDFTTNYFQAYDVELTNGLNTITLTVSDLAGNVTITNLNVTLDYTTATNPPVLGLIWPTNGAHLSGETFYLRGWINDETASVKAQIADSGVTNEFAGLVERNGTFWVEDLPLASGTNLVTLVAEDAAGNLSSTNLSVVKSSVTLTITSTPEGESLYEPFGTVAGTVSDPDCEVTVHGVAATGANPSSRVTRIVSVFRPRRARRAPPRFVGRHAWRRRVADARPGGHALFR